MPSAVPVQAQWKEPRVAEPWLWSGRSQRSAIRSVGEDPEWELQELQGSWPRYPSLKRLGEMVVLLLEIVLGIRPSSRVS